MRSLLHRLGYRFRLRGADLPGCPDVVLPRWRLVIFIVDCRAHPHADCTRAAASVSAAAGAETRRLAQAEADLERQGWRTLRVPACAAADPESLGLRLDIAVQERLIAAACTPRTSPETARVPSSETRESHCGRSGPSLEAGFSATRPRHAEMPRSTSAGRGLC